MQRTEIKSLTSLRFFAALAVFFHHLHFLDTVNGGKYARLSHCFFEGFVGVNFFFILSGFIIAYSYQAKMERGDVLRSDFIFFRFARLFPTHILTFFLAVLAYGITISTIPMTTTIMNIFLLQSWGGVIMSDPTKIDTLSSFTYNGVSWSISTEMFFYATFCVLVFRSSTFLSVLLAGLLVAVVACLVFNPMPEKGTWLFYVNPVFRSVDFITGVLAFRLYASTKWRPTLVVGTTLEFGSLALVAAFMSIAISGHVSMLWRFDLYYLVPFAILVFVFSLESGLLSKALDNRTAILLGQASFCFYMLHQIIINLYVNTAMPATQKAHPIVLFVLAMLAATIIASIAVHFLFEKPMNELLKALWKRYSRHKAGSYAASYSKEHKNEAPLAPG